MTGALAVAIEPLFVLSAQTTVVKDIVGTPGGDRTVVDARGGVFEGAGLSGRIVPTGGDWLVRERGRSRMNVRLLLETHDGVTILFQYTGKASARNGEAHIEVAGSFDAPAGPYDWLNDIQAFGLGFPIADGVRYHFFRFK